MSEPELTVAVPAYNELTNLEPTVRELLSVLREAELRFEILLIDDGSTDGTGELADRLGAEFPAAVRVLHHPQNQGLGAFYRSAFQHARGSRLTFLGADRQVPTHCIVEFYQGLTDHDMVLGYFERDLESPQARFLSWAERVLYRLLFGSLPRFKGLIMFRREILAQVALHSPAARGWGILMELIVRVHRRGYRMRSLPTPFRPRVHGRSKVRGLSTIWANVRDLLVIRWYMWRHP